jgi:hypothetical protein
MDYRKRLTNHHEEDDDRGRIQQAWGMVGLGTNFMTPKKQIKEISNCCKAPLITHSSDEGTGYYECSSCHKACDAAVEEQIKETVEWRRDCSNGQEHIPECQGCDDICVLTRGDLEVVTTRFTAGTLSSPKPSAVRRGVKEERECRQPDCKACAFEKEFFKEEKNCTKAGCLHTINCPVDKLPNLKDSDLAKGTRTLAETIETVKKLEKIQKRCKCHCHFGGDYKECTKVKGHPVVTCEHCTPPQELPEQDAVCTEHGREGCSHKFPQEQDRLFECEDCKQWVRAKVVTFIDGKYSIENHVCVPPQEPQEQECEHEWNDYVTEIAEYTMCKKCHILKFPSVPQGESMEERFDKAYDVLGLGCLKPQQTQGLINFIRTELSRERQSVIQVLEGLYQDESNILSFEPAWKAALSKAISLLSERKGQ